MTPDELTPTPPSGYRLLTDEEAEPIKQRTQPIPHFTLHYNDTTRRWCGIPWSGYIIPKGYSSPWDFYAIPIAQPADTELTQLRAELARIRAEVEAAPHEYFCQQGFNSDTGEVQDCTCFKSRIL